MKKIIGQELWEDEDVFLVFNYTNSKKISAKSAKKLKLEKEDDTWYTEMPAKSKDKDKLIKAFEDEDLDLIIEEYKIPEIKPMSGKKLETGLKLYKSWIVAKELMSKATEEVATTKEDLEEYVYKYGVKTKSGTEDSIMILDSVKLHYQYTVGRVSWDEDEALKWAKSRKGKKFKDIIEKIEQINDDIWDLMKKGGHIPDKIIAKCEKQGKGFYRFCSYDLSESVCPECGDTIKKKDKFCASCGEKL